MHIENASQNIANQLEDMRQNTQDPYEEELLSRMLSRLHSSRLAAGIEVE